MELASFWRRVLVYFGLALPDDGRPRGAGRRSRYGPAISPRLDEDIDEIKQRLEDLNSQHRRQ